MKIIFGNKALRILIYTEAMVLVAAAMIGPIYAIFVEEIGGNLLDASLTIGVFALAAGITTIIAGKYMDKIKENELILVFSYGIIGLGFLLYLFVNSIWFLFLVQVVIGIGEAIYAPAIDVIYSKHLDKGKAGRQWGEYESMLYFAAAAGAVIGGFVATKFGFNVVFMAMAALSFFSAAYIYFLPRRAL